MIPITIYRSDFKDNKDSEGWPYFNYLLAALGFKEAVMDKVEEVNIFFVKAKIFDSEGREIR